jgi:hypothetical protein
MQINVGETNLTIRDIAAPDMPQVLALHQTVFGNGADSPWFNWKYGGAAGKGEAVGAWAGDALIAFCGGVPRTLRCQEQTIRGLQIGDVMVHPQWRGILTRRGPFFHVSEQFYASRLGSNGKPFEMGYGFPSERHLKLAVLLGLLHDDGRVESLQWALTDQNHPLPWTWRCEEILPDGPQWDRAVESAWRCMQTSMGNATYGMRNAAYMRWRYADRARLTGPLTRHYRYWGLRRAWSHHCRGLAVMEVREQSAQWLDWVGTPALMPMGHLAITQAAFREGAQVLSAWVSRAVAHALADTSITHRAVCAGLGVPVASSVPNGQMPGDNWWLMGGDTDFL